MYFQIVQQKKKKPGGGGALGGEESFKKRFVAGIDLIQSLREDNGQRICLNVLYDVK